MRISYELNPPKIVSRDRFDPNELRKDIRSMVERASQLSDFVNGIHLTDSVLGVARVSSVTAASLIKERVNTKLSCSIRVRDRNFTSLCQMAADAILIGVDSLLILLGDNPANGPSDSGLRPSAALEMLRREGFSSNVELDLS